MKVKKFRFYHSLFIAFSLSLILGPIPRTIAQSPTLCEAIVNGGFEKGDLSGWDAIDAVIFNFLSFNELVRSGRYSAGGIHFTMMQDLPSIPVSSVRKIEFYASTLAGMSTTVFAALEYADGEYTSFNFKLQNQAWWKCDLDVGGLNASKLINKLVIWTVSNNPIGIDDVTLLYHTSKGVLRIYTTPIAGEIYVDSVNRGVKRAVISVSPGLHTVSFGRVPGFKTPQDKIVDIKAGESMVISSVYLPHAPNVNNSIPGEENETMFNGLRQIQWFAPLTLGVVLTTVYLVKFRRDRASNCRVRRGLCKNANSGKST
ncbi:MAG: hypothetical protein ACE5GD_02490 [Candidatus Geothermarchaeales archaeon]